MRALTLWQPWATAIALGVKRVETRPAWALQMRALTGEDVAIHAAVRNPDVGVTIGEYRTARLTGPGSAVVLDRMSGPGPLLGGYTLQERHRLPLGQVVAVARVEAVLPMVDVWDAEDALGPHLAVGQSVIRYDGREAVETIEEREWGEYAPGRVAVVLGDVRALSVPVACRGYQRVWRLPSVTAHVVTLEASLVTARDVRAGLGLPEAPC